MLKKETLNLIDIKNLNLNNIFSICLGKHYMYQRRFIDYIGKYNRWDVDVPTGKLKLDDRILNVEFTTAVMEIVGTFKTDHKLMIKALLIENDIPSIEEDKMLKANFTNESIMNIEFNDDYSFKGVSGLLSE